MYLFVAVGFSVAASVSAQDALSGDTVRATPAAPPVQSAEAIALDDRLAKEMDDYRARHREFRRTLRQKHPRGEDRIAAIEKWEKDHKAWNTDWERRKNHLEKIWNWGPEGKPGVPERVDDLTTATGRVAAAIRKIRGEEKGSGRAGARIEKWLEDNKSLVEQAEAERAVPPAPEDGRVLAGTPGEVELLMARRELQRIRKELLAQGRDVLQAAMRNPESTYSQKKRALMGKAELLEESNRSKAVETLTNT